MVQNEKKKQVSPLTIAIWIGVFLLFFCVDALSEDSLALLIVAIGIMVVLKIVMKAVKKASAAAGGDHSHDRIDHTRDVRINPGTGRAENRPVTSVRQHSAREHWKEQMDALLANGTIDRAEYRAMMKRKF